MWSEVALYTQGLKKVLLPLCLNVNREEISMAWLGISRIIYSCVGGKRKKIEWNQFFTKNTNNSPFHKENNNKVNFFHLAKRTMEITVKFIDYGNEISVSKVDPRCSRSAAYAIQFKIRLLNSLYTWAMRFVLI